MLFFVIAALMVVVAVALVVFPIMRLRSVPTVQRDGQNIAIARERLSQLEEQVEAGLTTPGQADQEKSEIELSLLDDVGEVECELPVEQNNRGKWAGFAVAASVPVLAGVIYLVLGQPAALAPIPIPESTQASPPHSGLDMATMVQRLEQRMVASPNDPEGWNMLGNSYVMLKRFDKAVSVFQKLRELVGDNPDLLVRQADALAMTKGGVLAGEPEELVARALHMKPDHPVGLWLAGIAAQQRGDIETALVYWQRAEPLFGGDPKSLAELQGMIAQAKNDLADVDVVTQTKENNAASGTTIASAQDSKGYVKVKVALHDSLQDQVSEQDTLFVLARVVSGPPMPLAVVRKQAGALPLTITLDDSMAMAPQMRLSNYKEVTIIAKVSKSGDARTKSGDLIGQVSPVSPGNDQWVNILISKQVP